MGTNYYFYGRSPCSECHREFAPLHIGKSSSGWCFALHVYPGGEIQSLADWQALWDRPGTIIKNEYGESVSVEEMRRVILSRAATARHELDPRHCIGHGDGTYDLCVGPEDSW